MKRRALTFIIAVAMAMAMVLAIPAFSSESQAISTNRWGDYYFDINEGEAIITCYVGDETEIVVPSQLLTYPVTAIDSGAFKLDEMTSIELPDGLTYIGYQAFYRCSNLSRIELPLSLKEIGNEAFYQCLSLTDLDLPDSVTSIGDKAFCNCRNLSRIDLPGELTSIGDEAFSFCESLTGIKLPDGLEYIGGSAFMSCDSLTSIELPDGLTAISEGMFSGCTGLTSIVLPDGLTSIGDDAFHCCYSLTEIELPDGVTSIGDRAFLHCESLTSVKLPDGLISIGDSAFHSCYSLTSIELPDSVTEIGGYVFTDCTVLTTIELPISLKNISNGVFYSCDSLTSIVLPDGLTSIGAQAFYGCDSLTSIDLPDSVTEIGYSAFRFCTDLTDIDLPDGLSLTYIGDYAFGDCDSLTDINLPVSVTSIGEYAFYSCYSLTEIELPDGLESIGEYAFCKCTGLTRIDLPEGLEAISDHTFFYCADLISIELPDGLVSIGVGAFEDCESLESIELPDSVTSIADDAFYGCDYITICGEAGSYAETYAKENNIPFSTGTVVEWNDPTYTWSKDYSSVTATRVSKSDSSVKETETVGTTSKVTKKATCEAKGVTTYTTKAFKNTAFTQQSKKVTNISALGHAWGEPAWKWTGYTKAQATFTCSRCDKTQTLTAEGEAITSKITRQPTAEATGIRTYTAAVTFNGKKYTGTKTEVIPAKQFNEKVQGLKAASYDQKISLSWTAVDNADGYYIYAMYSDGSKYKTYSTTNTSCNFTGLINGNKYQFKVRAYKINAAGSKEYGSYSDTVSAVPRMDAVSGFKVLPFSQKVNVSWQAMDKADGYYVNVVNSDGTLYKNYSTTKNSVNFTKLTNGKTYKFRVRAYELNSKGSKVYGKYCSYVSAVPYDDTVQNLKAASYDQKIRLSWDAVKSAEGYYIYAMYADGSKYKTYSTTKTACNFTKLTNGNKYQFKVREYKKNAAGSKVYGSYSKTVSAVPRMNAVSGFKALPFSQKVNVSWQAMDKADGYYVNVVNSDGTLYKNYSTTKTSVNFTKLTNGKTYKFRVRAYELNSKGSKVYGKYTSYKSVKPYNDKVTGLKAVGGTNKVALSWTAVDKAEGYNIYAMYADGSKYKTYNTTKTTCNFTSLKSGSTYQFKVREYKKNAAGSKVYGTYSSVVKATAK